MKFLCQPIAQTSSPGQVQSPQQQLCYTCRCRTYGNLWFATYLSMVIWCSAIWPIIWVVIKVIVLPHSLLLPRIVYVLSHAFQEHKIG